MASCATTCLSCQSQQILFVAFVIYQAFFGEPSSGESGTSWKILKSYRQMMFKEMGESPKLQVKLSNVHPHEHNMSFPVHLKKMILRGISEPLFQMFRLHNLKRHSRLSLRRTFCETPLIFSSKAEQLFLPLLVCRLARIGAISTYVLDLTNHTFYEISRDPLATTSL